MRQLKPRPDGRARQAGLSIVELMVGVAVGLVVVTGASMLFASNLRNSQRLLVEARVNQDLRAAADVVARDLRRAGYWENSIAGTVTPSTGATATGNVNAPVSADAATSTITYSVARDTANLRCTASSCSDNTLQDDEQFGFKLQDGVLKMLVGGNNNWQPLTDSSIVTINSFTIAPTEASLDISAACAKTCTTGCPVLKVRSYVLVLKGTAVADSNVTRLLRETIRVRNDATSGSCPV